MGTKEAHEAREAAEKAKREPSHHYRWWFNQPVPIDRFTGWLVAWTFLLFIATIGSAGVLWKTDNTLHETLIETRRAAEAASAAVEVAERTAERQLRAYITISSVSLSLIGTAANGDIRIKNSGQTPAKKVVIRAVIATSADIPKTRTLPAYFGDYPSNFGLAGVDPRQETNIVGQGAESQAGISVGEISKNPPPKSPFAPFPNRIFVIGAVYYTDIFGKQRFTRFCSYFVSAIQSNSCTEHNDAN